MDNKHISLEDMIEFTRPVIMSINLITKTNFKSNESIKNMFKVTLNSLEAYLIISDSNRKCVEEAIEFNLFQSLFIENEDSDFSFREKTKLVFNILEMEDSIICNIVTGCINFIEEDTNIRDKTFYKK